MGNSSLSLRGCISYVHVCEGDGDIVLCGCRHPCIEQQDNISFISNDVTLIRGWYVT